MYSTIPNAELLTVTSFNKDFQTGEIISLNGFLTGENDDKRGVINSNIAVVGTSKLWIEYSINIGDIGLYLPYTNDYYETSERLIKDKSTTNEIQGGIYLWSIGKQDSTTESNEDNEAISLMTKNGELISITSSGIKIKSGSKSVLAIEGEKITIGEDPNQVFIENGDITTTKTKALGKSLNSIASQP